MKASHCCSMRKVAEGRKGGRKEGRKEAVDAALVRGARKAQQRVREFDILRHVHSYHRGPTSVVRLVFCFVKDILGLYIF